MASELIAEGLACERNGRLIFRDLSLAVAPGGCAVLRGPNGAGKSSLLRVIAGLVPLAAGRLRYGDDDVARQCHYVGHLDALKGQLTARENLNFWAAMMGGRIDEVATSVFGMSPLMDEQVAIFSVGQRRRLALTRLLAVRRNIWLLDEPTTALDGQAQGKLLDAIAQHRASGGLIILATHDELDLPDAQTVRM